jgi:hypothetical protein
MSQIVPSGNTDAQSSEDEEKQVEFQIQFQFNNIKGNVVHNLDQKQ